MKQCDTCGDTKPLEDYAYKVRAAGKRQGKCRLCQKEYVREHYRANRAGYIANAKKHRKAAPQRHRLSPDEHAYLLGIYGGKCHLCREREAVVVDHDHACCPGPNSCGTCVRGILCQRCNIGLGTFGDTVDGALRAVAYLETVA